MSVSTKTLLSHSAIGGAVLWVVICLVPLDPNLGIGTIEKLFLLAPLVIVPLGLSLVEPRNSVERAACYLQQLFGLAVVASFFLPQGKLAGALVAPWFLVTALCGLGGLLRFWQGAFRRVGDACFAMALLMLPAGGIGLLQSRLGLEPLGYREPVVLLVGVHFHYAAFVSPLMAGAVLRRLDASGRNTGTIAWTIAICSSVGSPVLAAGYLLFVPWLRLVGATMLVLGLFGVALMTFGLLPAIRPRVAQLLLSVASGSVLVAMAYAAVYALADFYGEVWLAIPFMARTHGIINALGFSLCGLLGWTLAAKAVAHETNTGRVNSGLRPLTRRWQI